MRFTAHSIVWCDRLGESIHEKVLRWMKSPEPLPRSQSGQILSDAVEKVISIISFKTSLLNPIISNLKTILKKQHKDATVATFFLSFLLGLAATAPTLIQLVF